MGTEAKKDMCTLCDKIGLKPFTKENIFYYYIPAHGVVSYGALAINIMNPSMVTKLARGKDISNVLLLSTMIGSAFYLYGRPHLRALTESKRGAYSMVGATLFSMGSVLAWAILKPALPKNNTLLATLVGLASGVVIIKLSTDYLTDCDQLAASKK